MILPLWGRWRPQGDGGAELKFSQMAVKLTAGTSLS